MVSRRGFFARLLGAAGAVAVAPHVDLTLRPAPAPFRYNPELLGWVTKAWEAECSKVERHLSFMESFDKSFSEGATIRVKLPRRFRVDGA